MGSVSRGRWALLVVVGASAFGAPSPSDADLELNVPRAATLAAEPAAGAAEFVFVAPTDASFTVDAESLDFDPRLQVFAGDDLVAKDDDSGVAFNPRVALAAHAGVRYRVEVSSQSKRRGDFAVIVREAAASAAAPDSAADDAQWIERTARRALERNEPARALPILFAVGQMRFKAGALDEAKTDFTAMLDAARATAAREEEALALGFLGAVANRQGDFHAAEPLLEQSLALCEKVSVADSFPCFVLDHLGEVRLALDRPSEALATFERFSAIADPLDAGLAALAWSKRARALAELGRDDEARAAHDNAIGRVGAEQKVDAYYESQVRGNHGAFLESLGLHEPAIAELEHALAVVPASSRDVRIDLLGNACSTLVSLGRLADARKRLAELETVAADRALPAQARLIRLTSAIVAFRLGNRAAAREQLHALYGELDGPGNGKLRGQILLQLAAIEIEEGAIVTASGYLEDADRLCQGDGPAIAERRFAIRADQAKVARMRGDLSEARRLQLEAQTAARACGDAGAAATADAGLAFVEFLRGDLDAAERLARSTRTTMEHLGVTARVLDVLETLVRVELARGELDRADEDLRAAAAILDGDGVRALGSIDAALVRGCARFGELTVDAALARARVKDAPPAARADAFRRADECKGRALREGLETAVMSAGVHDDPNELCGRLGADRVVVDFAEGTSELAAFVLLRGEIHLVSLGAKDVVSSATEAYVAAIENRAAPRMLVALGLELRARLAPALDLIPSDTHDVTVIPTPILAQLPFEAIVLSPPPGDRGDSMRDAVFAGDRWSVAYAPSSRVLLDMSTRPPRTGPRRALLIGDPICALEDGATAQRGPDPDLRLPRLDGAKRELISVARLCLLSDPEPEDAQAFADLARLEVERNGARSLHDFDVYLGKDCVVDHVRGDLKQYSILHFATHGLVDRVDPRRTGLLFSGPDGGQALFTLSDVLGARLDADLVVLSACETARGRVVRGEGVESLAWAFLRAGSRAVIATLWRVDDETSATLMTDVYDHLLREGKSPAEALTAAKRRLRQSPERGRPLLGSTASDRSGDPWIWASFVVIGAAR